MDQSENSIPILDINQFTKVNDIIASFRELSIVLQNKELVHILPVDIMVDVVSDLLHILAIATDAEHQYGKKTNKFRAKIIPEANDTLIENEIVWSYKPTKVVRDKELSKAFRKTGNVLLQFSRKTSVETVGALNDFARFIEKRVDQLQSRRQDLLDKFAQEKREFKKFKEEFLLGQLGWIEWRDFLFKENYHLHREISLNERENRKLYKKLQFVSQKQSYLKKAIAIAKAQQNQKKKKKDISSV